MERRDALKKLGIMGAGALIMPGYPDQMRFYSTSDPRMDAWESLGNLTRERYEFRYIHPVEDLPKVFLYGDSISIGYTEYTRTALSGQACLYRLHKNGESSHVFIDNMEKLRKTMFSPHLESGWDFRWDLIHFNVGLHDLKYTVEGKLDRDKGKQVSSLSTYQDNLRKIIRYLKDTWPGTRLVFATTTPVPEGEPGRFEGDAMKYNHAAAEVLQDHEDVRINDLYGFIKPEFSELAIRPGNVHFSKAGYRKLGLRVAETVAAELGIQTVPIPGDDILMEREKAWGAG